MPYRLRLAILSFTCLCGIHLGLGGCMNGEKGYSVLVHEGNQLLASKPVKARLRYAQAMQQGSSAPEKARAALLLVMTFEKDGMLQETEARSWAAQRFDQEEDRTQIEESIQEYRRKFLGEEPLQSSTTCALRPPILTSQPEDVGEEIQSIACAELIRNGEELNLQGRYAEARELCAKAMESGPKEEMLSRATKVIVLSFQDDDGLDVNACKTWAEVNIPLAENRLRVGVGVGEYYYRNKNYDQAIAHLESIARETGPSGDAASLVIALSLLRQGKQDAALAGFSQIVENSSSDEISPKAMFLIGWVHLQTQRYADAEAAFDRLIQKYPESKFAEKAAELSNRQKVLQK